MAKKKTTKRGRPRKLANREARQAILRLVRGGVSFGKAVKAVDCHYHTLLDEIKRDPEFAAQIRRAKAQRIATLTAIVFRHAEEDPKTAVHLLSCLDPTYAKNKEPKRHVHVHAEAPPAVFEIVDKRKDDDGS